MRTTARAPTVTRHAEAVRARARPGCTSTPRRIMTCPAPGSLRFSAMPYRDVRTRSPAPSARRSSRLAPSGSPARRAACEPRRASQAEWLLRTQVALLLGAACRSNVQSAGRGRPEAGIPRRLLPDNELVAPCRSAGRGGRTAPAPDRARAPPDAGPDAWPPAVAGRGPLSFNDRRVIASRGREVLREAVKPAQTWSGSAFLTKVRSTPPEPGVPAGRARGGHT